MMHVSEAKRMLVDTPVRWTLDPQIKHLNHGSFGAVPFAVQEEQARLRNEMEANPVRWFAGLPEQVGAARQAMAAHLDVPSDALAFVQNVSAGASVVYQSMLGQTPVDVMVTNHGYGAVSMGGERLATRTGGRFHVTNIPLAASAQDVIDIVASDLQQHRPGLLVVDQITSATARSLPADEICRIARALGTTTLVDGAHAPGIMADPVCREADFWVGNLHKFACSPRGAGVLVRRSASADLFPLIDSWGTPLPYPERFDHSGTMDVTAWLAAPFAWEYMAEHVGWNHVRQSSTSLADEAVVVLERALSTYVDDPLPDVGQPVGPMRLLRLPGNLGSTRLEADAMRTPFMDEAGVALSFTSFEGRGYLRLSSHIYNTISDYQHLATVGIPLLHRWSQSSTEEQL